MQCMRCGQIYCEGTEGDVMIHAHSCQLVINLKKEKQRREDAEKALKPVQEACENHHQAHIHRVGFVAKKHFEKYKGTK